MDKFIRIAEANGYQMWYDCAIRLWTLTHKQKETEYFTKLILTEMGLLNFDHYLKAQNESQSR